MKNLISFGKKIRDCRITLGLTQDELAKKVGYTSRSSINKIELGLVDLPQSKIALIANALGTTPAYLMGWEEVMEDKRMESGHRELVALIEQLTDEEVAELSNFVDYIISKRK